MTKKPGQLECSGQRLGYYTAENEFKHTTNFNPKVIGYETKVLNGGLYSAFFPMEKSTHPKEERVFVPSEDYLKPDMFRHHTGDIDKDPQYYLLPWANNGKSGFSYHLSPSLRELYFKFGGKDCYEKLFDILSPGNHWQSVIGYAAGMSCTFSQIIRKKFGQHPVVVVVSPEKGVGKSYLMKAVLYAYSDTAFIFNNNTTNEYILWLADRTSMIIGLEDTSKVNKEQQLLVSLFDSASCGLKGDGLSQSKAEFFISTTNKWLSV